ncbi:hypothetical protein CLAFUW4_05219 [Fulvia fulva]|uniref:Uncharacterized protein n=1 Tax=Passalora fulva TaxID=5499 RepID=A0A9Q8PH23_PASFU|nr:uncharacterized protein CLAFUR5_11687 [Fulvia fulva]KAK4626951.1 hypothetical protein CLAFUR4_05205 [Fulvia fulva]KAK4627937.1 hypothetical protein CLAFUR0_05211 [Fulvia fulva]UJO22514.1 hypothetical protein CLAFUR5_11687 [Fulvia fulva]WPV13932.1 hypothetical protein CLAFUW4_05219 [Fulvia fulva]WPV29260.1 hypothetical protein CLAFUW7_05215 [Fulvia fulva]
MGCETTLGAAAIQLFHHAPPNAKIFATSTMSRQRDLFQRVSQTFGLGCVYAIDRGIEDLVDSLKGDADAYGASAETEGNRFDVVVDAVAGGLPRRDVLTLLKEGGDAVDLEGQEVDKEMLDDLDTAGKKELEDMLVEAARVFDVYVEPPTMCGFSDEQ